MDWTLILAFFDFFKPPLSHPNHQGCNGSMLIILRMSRFVPVTPRTMGWSLILVIFYYSFGATHFLPQTPGVLWVKVNSIGTPSDPKNCGLVTNISARVKIINIRNVTIHPSNPKIMDWTVIFFVFFLFYMASKPTSPPGWL
jgi:hypothetical protein